MKVVSTSEIQEIRQTLATSNQEDRRSGAVRVRSEQESLCAVPRDWRQRKHELSCPMRVLKHNSIY